MSERRILSGWKLVVGVVGAALGLSIVACGQFGVRPSGERVTKLAPEGTLAVALFFVASDCPVSNRTFPEMKRIRESFSKRGVKVWFVYPNNTERVADVVAHQRDFDAGGDVILDSRGELVAMTHAQVTPEVAVLVPAVAGKWNPVYTGRVDDRFVHLGLERPHPTEHFAEQVLEAALDGKPVPKATGTPVGCGIMSGARP
jgi:AhpC/TSA family